MDLDHKRLRKWYVVTYCNKILTYHGVVILETEADYKKNKITDTRRRKQRYFCSSNSRQDSVARNGYFSVMVSRGIISVYIVPWTLPTYLILGSIQKRCRSTFRSRVARMRAAHFQQRTHLTKYSVRGTLREGSCQCIRFSAAATFESGVTYTLLSSIARMRTAPFSHIVGGAQVVGIRARAQVAIVCRHDTKKEKTR